MQLTQKEKEKEIHFKSTINPVNDARHDHLKLP
jgi:hypothetical protein